jgi:hypothetical protein
VREIFNFETSAASGEAGLAREVLCAERFRDHDPVSGLTRTFWNCSFLVDIDVHLSPSVGSPNG